MPKKYEPTQYEYTRLVGTRATQLENGSTPLIDDIEQFRNHLGMVDLLALASAEIDKGLVPLVIIRKYDTGEEKIVIKGKIPIKSWR